MRHVIDAQKTSQTSKDFLFPWTNKNLILDVSIDLKYLKQVIARKRLKRELE